MCGGFWINRQLYFVSLYANSDPNDKKILHRRVNFDIKLKRKFLFQNKGKVALAMICLQQGSTSDLQLYALLPVCFLLNFQV